MNSHKCINLCSPNLHKDIKCYLHCTKFPRASFHSFPPPEANSIIMFSSPRLVVSLLGLQINGIIQYGLFCVRLLSFNMFLRFIHVSAACSFLLLSSILIFFVDAYILAQEYTTVHAYIFLLMDTWALSSVRLLNKSCYQYFCTSFL